MPGKYDAIITGSGPNGLAAAIFLQQKGLKTAIFEQSQTIGGACQTMELTLPGYMHDIGAAIHPLAYHSPYFTTLPLEQHGLNWIHPPIPFVHPFDDGDAYACYQSVDDTAAQLGSDRQSYRRLFTRLTSDWETIAPRILGPLRMPLHPFKMARFGVKALMSAKWFASTNFSEEKTRLLFYGAAAHSTLPLTWMATASFGLVLNILGHHIGWPFPEGGAGNITRALASLYSSLGGEIFTGVLVENIDQLPPASAYLFDLTPRQLLNIKGTRFSENYRKKLSGFKYGPGVFKIDYALNNVIPFTNEKCLTAGTLHIGFSTKEIEKSEALVNKGRISGKPYLLLCQHSVFDKSRAPDNKHTAWVYCHVPNGSTTDMTTAIENQIERAAPGFRDCIVHRSVMTTQQLQKWNPNLVGGDINGGRQDISQLFSRPVNLLSPYTTPDPRVFICSSSTPPGGGVHGMAGFHAAAKAWETISGNKKTG